MSLYYHSDARLIQNSIGVYMLGLAVAQLFYGPLSDFYGRTKVLYVGLSIYLASSVVLFISSSFDVLLYFRVFQGIGACAGMVIARAIISDRLDSVGASMLYLMIFPVIGVSPAISPLIGEAISWIFGFKACFLFLILFSFSSLLLCIFKLDESLDLSNRKSFSLKNLFANVVFVVKNRSFMYFALLACFGYGEYFAYLVESSFLLEKFGMDKENVWMAYALLSGFYIVGNLAAKYLSPKIGLIPTMAIGIYMFFFGCSAFAVQFYIVNNSLFLVLFCMVFVAMANGFLMPIAIAKGVASCEEVAGSASGVMGFLQIGFAGLCASFTGTITQGVPKNLGHLIFVIGACAMISFLYGYKKYAK